MGGEKKEIGGKIVKETNQIEMVKEQNLQAGLGHHEATAWAIKLWKNSLKKTHLLWPSPCRPNRLCKRS